MTIGVGAPIYPVGLVVKGRRCLVVGGGRVAARKIGGLLACGAAVSVVAPEVHVAIGELTDSGVIAAIDESPLEVQIRPYAAGEAAHYVLVIAATGDPAVDDAVYEDAQSAGVWVNVADDPSRCSVVLPAVARDGPVSIAVSTAGASPALAGWLRDRIVEALGPGVGDLAALLGEGRRRMHDEGRSTETIDWRRLLDGPLPNLVRQGRVDEARRELDAFLADPSATDIADAPRDRSPGRDMP
jgi:siroheme synthase-like protein